MTPGTRDFLPAAYIANSSYPQRLRVETGETPVLSRNCDANLSIRQARSPGCGTRNHTSLRVKEHSRTWPATRLATCVEALFAIGEGFFDLLKQEES
jgi:hypothetical protein